MTAESESKQEGIAPELAAKGFWNETAPTPPTPPEPEAKKEPEKEPEKKEEPPKQEDPPKDSPAKEEPKQSPEEERLSRRKARVEALVAKRNATLALIEQAGDDKALAAVHSARSEEQDAELQAAIAEMNKEYFDKLEKAIPEPDVREATIEYSLKYTPEIETKAPEFSAWWIEQPMHFETLAGLYHCFAQKTIKLEDFLEMTNFDKKKLIGDMAKIITEAKAKKTEGKPAEQKPAEQKKEPLPKVDGDSPKISGDEMQTVYEQQRARRLQKYAGK